MILQKTITEKERDRLETQALLDAAKTQAERNRMGQFATPPQLALEIFTYAKHLLPANGKIHFFDPGFGTGSFYSALLQTFPAQRISQATGFEIDPDYYDAAHRIWSDTGIDIKLVDFTKADTDRSADRFNLVVCNPPYVRHHHIVNGDKKRIQALTYKACGLHFSGLAGLYCHFLGISHAWMKEGGIAAWLIPSEFMDVNYGTMLKNYLLNKVRLLHIHRFDPYDLQFGDALVSSAVVWFKKETPPKDYDVEFSFGGTLLVPKLSRKIAVSTLHTMSKWTRLPQTETDQGSGGPRLSDFFVIKRGLATGDNSYFILTPEQIAKHGLPHKYFRPILPGPRYLSMTEIFSDEKGNPVIDKPLFLLDCQLPESIIKKQYPTLWRYLQAGQERGVTDRYLCQHRSPWYSQEKRPPAPFVCTYLGRGNIKSGRPFRFILNHSHATVTNVYLALYPKPRIAQAMKEDPHATRHIWKILSEISPDSMLAHGRVYGGGLHKLEPKELANVPIPDLGKYMNIGPQ